MRLHSLRIVAVVSAVAVVECCCCGLVLTARLSHSPNGAPIAPPVGVPRSLPSAADALAEELRKGVALLKICRGGLFRECGFCKVRTLRQA